MKDLFSRFIKRQFFKIIKLTKEDIILHGFHIQRFQITSNFQLCRFVGYRNDALRVFNF